MTDPDKILAAAAAELAESFVGIMKKHGNYAAMFGGHLSNIGLILEVAPKLKTKSGVASFAAVIRDNEMQFVMALCEVLDVPPGVVMEIANGMTEHAHLIRADIKERMAVDANVVPQYFNQKGKPDGEPTQQDRRPDE